MHSLAAGVKGGGGVFKTGRWNKQDTHAARSARADRSFVPAGS